MNIQEAKQEIIYTIRAYLEKNADGMREIPPERQRPVLLMGPPGIGKTAIMQQIAEELGIGLVSYTITHHTRQSAIGLPYIARKNYGGKDYQVTEYTMSEIVASVYDQIERSGISEGILFLDEINCVSETLSPTMLQFLQYKTFGTHRLPESFVLVCAGNPPEYNRSVRDFDVVTLDRVKRLDIREDFAVWKSYARERGVHGAVLAYLEIHRDHFYRVQTDAEGRHFVTARAWEDLSDSLKVYEKLKIPVTEAFAGAFLQDTEIARGFAVYYELWNRYRNIYRIPDILEGEIPEDRMRLLSAPFDEKLSLTGLLVTALEQEFARVDLAERVQKRVFGSLKAITRAAGERQNVNAAVLRELAEEQVGALMAQMEQKRNAHMLSRQEERESMAASQALKELSGWMEDTQAHSVREWFAGREDVRKQEAEAAGRHLTCALRFMAAVYGEGQELVILLSQLAGGWYSMKYVQTWGNEEFYHYNRLLLLKDQKRELAEEIRRL